MTVTVACGKEIFTYDNLTPSIFLFILSNIVNRFYKKK